jgi:uncharacterized protein (TIGR03067 family)
MRIARLVPLLFAFAVSTVFAQGADELKEFEGTWVLVSAKRDGQPVAADQVAKGKITWKGKEVVTDTPHQHKEPIKATATIPAPKSMDFTRANGPDAGKVILALYEFRGPDEYVIVFAPAGKDRPKELDSKAGSGTTMHVWKRQK